MLVAPSQLTIDMKALKMIQLCLFDEVLTKETMMSRLLSRLESLYMTKSFSSKLLIWKRFFMIRMTEVMVVKYYLANCSSAFLDLARIDEIADEIQAMQLLCHYPFHIGDLGRLCFDKWDLGRLFDTWEVILPLKMHGLPLSKELIDQELMWSRATYGGGIINKHAQIQVYKRFEVLLLQ